MRWIMPGLLGPWGEAASEVDLRLPALERLLDASQQKVCAGQDYEATMFGLFGVQSEPGRDLPVAAVSRLGDGGLADDAFWIRADPVHLQAELKHTRIIDARLLHVSREEAADLAVDFNELLASDGYRLDPLDSARWYLRLTEDPHIQTTPLPALIGGDISTHLPRGPGKERWHGLLTELQMLAHKSDVNSEREWDNQLAINSVWFWGGGTLPATSRPAAHIFALDPLARGLAICSGDSALDRPDSLANEAATDSLISFETLRYFLTNSDVFRWKDRLRQLEATWFVPVIRLFKERKIDRLSIYPCNGTVLEVSPAKLRWRRFHPTRHLAQRVR